MRAKDFLLLYEAQQELFEVEMSPSNLKRLASSIPGVKVGMEFEMVVPDVTIDEDDIVAEPDYEYDQRAESIGDILAFMGHEDENMGQINNPGVLHQLEEELRDEYYNYMHNEAYIQWRGAVGKEFFAIWIAENVDPNEIIKFVEAINSTRHHINRQAAYKLFIDDQWDSEGSYYDEALIAFTDYLSESDLYERDFLRSIEITNMSDVIDNLRTPVEWPYFLESSGTNGSSIESIGEEFERAIGKLVHTSSYYHGAKRDSNAYSLEPDDSIAADSDRGHVGLEFISPPMSIDEMFEDLKKVKKWADERGCFTNNSTGLHINVSIPNYSLDNLDYVKLAILLGDTYVLEQFGRLSNTYTKSALDIIKERAKSFKDVDILLKQLKNNVKTIASKILHRGVTDKFTSINTKSDYIEFRSAGGDWLDKNFDKIEKTILRNIVALDAACDPDKYKKEYVKGLYKLLNPNDSENELGMYTKYIAGEVSHRQYLESLFQVRAGRLKTSGINILRSDQINDGDWEITYDDGKNRDTIYIENNKNVSTKEDAFAAAKKFKPQWFKPDTIQHITVKSYNETPTTLRPGEHEYIVSNSSNGKRIKIEAWSPESAIYQATMIDPINFPGANGNTNITARQL